MFNVFYRIAFLIFKSTFYVICVLNTSSQSISIFFLGGEIVSDIERCETVKLGHCDLIEEVMIGEDHLLRFSGLPVGESCTIVLRGATEQILSEAERALHDVLCVLTTTISERFIVPGGGCIEMVMARAVMELAAQTSGKESLAMEAYARALLQV